jgi:hypothetical protein
VPAQGQAHRQTKFPQKQQQSIESGAVYLKVLSIYSSVIVYLNPENPMKAYVTLSLLALISSTLVGAAAYAETVSREQVIAELEQARADGELNHAEFEVNPLASQQATQRVAQRLAAKTLAQRQAADLSNSQIAQSR